MAGFQVIIYGRFWVITKATRADRQNLWPFSHSLARYI
jgi:hypothetical protein